MNTLNRTKINRLLSSTPKGVVLLSSWLKKKGYNGDLIKNYRKFGWLESIGVGANIRSSDNIDYYGALYSIQTQINSHIYIGGKSAFSTLGKSHYLEFGTKTLTLFSPRDVKLPIWFQQYDWGIEIKHYSNPILPKEMGLSEISIKEFTVKVSNEIRALIECLYLSPKKQDLDECYELMESMNNVHPKHVQELLENCTSIKVKRLFLYLSDKIGHEWFNHLNLSRVDLGKGKRSIVTNGIWDKKYQITIPRSWGTIE